MKKLFKTSGQLIIGALIGFFGMLVLLEADFRINLSAYASISNIVLLTIAALLALFSIYRYFSIVSLTNQKFTGDEEDAAEGRMYRQYSDASLCSNVAMLVSLASLSVTAITDQVLWMLVTGIALVFISASLSFLLPSLIQKMYPERQLPSVNEKNYAKKLLEVSDDGEKYVMLGGLYKTYLTMNSLLVGAIILLLFYSIVSDSSQLFSIFTIVIILTLTNTQYQFHVRNK
ncbi:DUF3169 family protein [Planococcus versutus]|uniref:DUF3169 domain-containing protein n=1 Tax=Planococcus versutus TaxID=1302659 RepID=A0A1B1S4R7_9BACL|nr:DUF3169 family protein [Planococcus versutus]ANU28183.1 hypothetical protein I858_014420 [Planococcus versutus]